MAKGLLISQTIMQKPPSSPMPSYIFNIKFRYSNGDGTTNEMGYNLLDESDRSMIAIKADLPSFDTHIKTMKFFGTEKSYPILRKHSGDTTLEFYMHSVTSENKFIVDNFFKPTLLVDYIRKEFVTIFDNIVIQMFDKTNNMVYTYTLYNCIPTKIEEGSVNYESDEVMKYSLSVHYDDWYINSYSNDKETK